MKHTREEILNALHVIKDTCSNVTDIQDCGLTAIFQNKEGRQEAIKAWNRRRNDRRKTK